MTGRKWLGAATLLATLISYRGYASGPLVESRALGMVMTAAPSSVLINGAPARSGTTVFRGDVLATPKAATALVKFRSGASLALTENSEVALEGAGPAAGTEKMNLHRGAINLRNPNPQAEWVTVPGAAVLVEGQGGFPAICRIAAVGQSAAIINDRGHVEIRGSGTPLILPIGGHATLEAGRPQGGSPAAGAVTAEIPRGNVQRGSQAPLPLNLNDKIYLQDVVKTEPRGRVRITLQDGSLLNVGANSQMRIMSHDATSHQTAIELTAGKLRSQVTPTQGGNFQVTTKTAVIGVVGTHFLVEADPNRTRVWCFEGLVNVRNLNAAIVGVVLLHAGEFTSIALGLPPAAVTSFSPAVTPRLTSQTNATGPVTGVSGVGSMSTVANAGTAGAGAAGAAGAGVAIGHADNASSLLDQAGTLLNSATTASNSANSNAATATNSANGANQATGSATGSLNGTLQDIISPTYPCGCH